MSSLDDDSPSETTDRSGSCDDVDEETRAKLDEDGVLMDTEEVVESLSEL
ncbi:hypothetical protein [Halorussus amylolyticus]|nr:hypothetical protein [Halorussus amylolyticus]